MDFLGALWTACVERVGSIVATIIVSVLSVLLWAGLKWLWRAFERFRYFIRSRRRALDAVGRVPTSGGLCEGRGVWLTRPVELPEDYARRVRASKVLAVANLKGGVGKTTLAANIGAYLAKERHLRVLLIDLDFQGSLSSMAFPQEDWVPLEGQNSLATQLISNDIRPQQLPLIARRVSLGTDANASLGQLAVITSFYDLAQAENRLMVEWLLNFQPSWSSGFVGRLLDIFGFKRFKLKDVRYVLAQILQTDVVEKAFDLIILDCPPRLTTAGIQAFCASSHLLIPTIFDRTSAEAVISFHQQIETLKQEGICRELKYLGVVGTKWSGNQIIPPMWRDQTRQDLEGTELSVLSDDMFFRHATAIVNHADEGIAYLKGHTVRSLLNLAWSD